VGGQAFSDGGDSGSLIVNSEMYAAALLFAGTENGPTFANPIGAVLDQLDADLLL
jgi:hypothetical protein